VVLKAAGRKLQATSHKLQANYLRVTSKQFTKHLRPAASSHKLLADYLRVVSNNSPNACSLQLSPNTFTRSSLKRSIFKP
jgi:hypothetical protein